MTSPDFQLLLLPLLTSLNDGEAHPVAHVLEKMSEYVEYSDDRLDSFKGTGNRLLMDAVATAMDHLAKAGLIEATIEDHVRITSFGKMILNRRLNSLDVEFLNRLTGRT